METIFSYFGYKYAIIDEEKKEVALYCAYNAGERVVIPSTVEYNGGTYTVTAIGPQKVAVYNISLGVRETDGRKKRTWKVTPPLMKDAECISPFMSYTMFHDYTNVFYANETITTIILPDSINELGDAAFRKCHGLKEIVNFPKSITKINTRLFSECLALESIVLPEGITSIGKLAFIGCSSLKEISIPSSVRTIDYRAFADSTESKSGLEVVNIMNSEGGVIIHPEAFTDRVKINYLGKQTANKAKADKKEPHKQEEEQVTAPAPTIDLDKLIEAVVADGVITDKERAVILKKATAAGYDADEVEILLDGKLAEKQSASQPTPKAEPKAEPKPEPKAAVPVTNGNGLVLQRGTVVADLKATFNARFGAKLRVYSGRSQAEESANLGELGLTKEGEFECRASLTVGSFIEHMQSEHGLKVKVYTCDEWVAALDGLTLESAGKVKKNAAKADMESMIAYQRTDNAVETAVVDIKKSVTYGDYNINIASNNSVTVLKGGVAYDNVKGALREIAEKEGFEYDPAWTTRQFGSKLVDFLNEKK